MPAGAGQAGGVGAAAHNQIHRQPQRLERFKMEPPAGYLRLPRQVGQAFHHQQVQVRVGPGAAAGAGAEQHQLQGLAPLAIAARAQIGQGKRPGGGPVGAAAGSRRR